MQISPCQWTRPGNDDVVEAEPNQAFSYHQLLECHHSSKNQRVSAALLDSQILQAKTLTGELPDDPENLQTWMQDSARTTNARYIEYLQQRKQGAQRRYFTNRAHALYFLRAVAPTKLVDGAWLYGLCKYWRNPKFKGLIRTYLEELGEGETDKNHVAIYKALLVRYDLDTAGGIDNDCYTQGLIQLALAENADVYLPELIGYNLGYEQLPLHLLISAYELNELNIDPYYFTLHITIDNAATGHAFRAVRAVIDNLPRLDCPDEFWQRVQTGYKLSNLGTGTLEVIHKFDIEKEVVRIFMQKSTMGHGAHSDYCRVAGRTVNEWLSCKENIPDLLTALQNSSWIVRNHPVGESRFWSLLQGKNADMFGVFNHYELQVIHDWIRGKDSHDGRPYTELANAAPPPSFRKASRLTNARSMLTIDSGPDAGLAEMPDPDLQALIEKLLYLDKAEQETFLLDLMSPSQHWTPAGVYATKLFNAKLNRS